MSAELQAFGDADFGWVETLESVWSDGRSGDAGGANADCAAAIEAELATLPTTVGTPGRVLVGQAGIGKTHLCGVLRRRAWATGGWFVLLDAVGITDFWKSAALSFVSSLLQPMPGAPSQAGAVVAAVARRLSVPLPVGADLSAPRVVNALVNGLMKHDFANACRYMHVVRAVLLLHSADLDDRSIAYGWLQGYDADDGRRKALGLAPPPPAPVEIVSGMSWLMAVAGPTLVAVDQIDGVLNSDASPEATGESGGAGYAALLTAGLLDLASKLKRGLIALAVLPSSWEIIKATAPASLLGRFAAPVALRVIQGKEAAHGLIAGRLAPAYAAAGIKPASPTGPFTDAAVASAAAGMTPRTILMACDEHRKMCLERGALVPCTTLAGPEGKRDGEALPSTRPEDSFDQAYAAAIAQADLAGLLDDRNDGPLGLLLRDALDLYAKQIAPHADYDIVSKADKAMRTPPLHGRLTITDHRRNDRERHFCFRALLHGSAVALCARLRAALTASGIAPGAPERRLAVVRRGPPPSGARTRELFEALARAGGIVIDPTAADLAAFVALRALRDEAQAGSRWDNFERWLVERRPLCATAFFRAAGLGAPPLPEAGEATPPPATPEGVAQTGPVTAQLSPAEQPIAAPDMGKAPPPPASPALIPVGRRLVGGEPVELSTDLLPRHTAIIAGAGSGKTVLLRRIVEEAALAGVPAIVIDPNNDLSRLGDAWPERPPGFTDDDAARAERYAAAVDVVVWTPGVHAGNPLFLPVLPDFAAVGDDPDERDQAVAMAADTLGPLAGARQDIPRGVLADALRRFASAGGGTLRDFTALLADLPEEASEIGGAGKLAARMADGLRAAVATNPLLKGTGPTVDPERLFYGPDPSRVRVSVINLSGLSADGAKEDFVNRLQMTLFGWIKRHPSPRGRLYVIDEAQLFIPSAAGALSRNSGVQLVAQARKYGLGMVVATQAPKGIDNKVVSNCTTQFLGKQNAPATIEAVRDLVAAAGGRADDFGRLATGEFYFKTEGSGKPVKIRTPVCLTHHPRNPPTPGEVAERARRSATG